MKAVIMAGGEGRRLRAVTGERPKPLVPLLGRPIMEHIILLLKKHGYTDICAAVKYRAEDIISAFGDGSALGVSLSYREETEPLGTAGGVKNCEDFYGGEDFLVISGDAACDFDLAEMMRRHKEKNAAVTLALCRHSSPLSYGLTVTDETGLVRAFVEKPDWARVVSDRVNTGIYIISPAVMELVPENEPFDFAKGLFPLLLEKGMPIQGLMMDGYWCDVGDPLSYYRCCVDALEGKLDIDIPESFRPGRPVREMPRPGEGYTLEQPCRSRAALMGALSQAMLEMDADYSDGIRLRRPHYSMHLFPVSNRSAIRIAVQSQNMEFASKLALSIKDLAEILDL